MLQKTTVIFSDSRSTIGLLKMQAQGYKAQEQGGTGPRRSFFEHYKNADANAQGIKIVQDWTDYTLSSENICKYCKGALGLSDARSCLCCMKSIFPLYFLFSSPLVNVYPIFYLKTKK